MHIVPLIFTADFVSSALWGIIPAILKIKYAINDGHHHPDAQLYLRKFLIMLIVGPWKGKTRFGDEARVVGNNPDAGIIFLKISLILMTISEGLAGFSGM